MIYFFSMHIGNMRAIKLKHKSNDLHLCMLQCSIVHTEKSFRNLVNPTQIWIVITFFSSTNRNSDWCCECFICIFIIILFTIIFIIILFIFIYHYLPVFTKLVKKLVQNIYYPPNSICI